MTEPNINMFKTACQSKIEILSVDLLTDLAPLVKEFEHLSLKLSKGLGWHYLLDLSWSASCFSAVTSRMILDAGAGTGLMQWWLAEQGNDVISVDRGSRHHIGSQFWKFYRLKGFRKNDLSPFITIHDVLPPRSLNSWRLYPKKLLETFKKFYWLTNIGKSGGRVFIYNQDLTCISDIPDNSVDDIVSISALEHNTPDGIRKVVPELMRVLKPGGRIIATLCASNDTDWFHDASKGWCYTEPTLREIFELPNNCSSNYDQYNLLFEALKNNLKLKNGLSDFYFRSGNNGMPWGEWNPVYQPVGILKVKE